MKSEDIMEKNRPLIIADPYPQTLERIFRPETRARLDKVARIVVSDSEHMDDAQFDSLLPEAVAVIGQSPMPKERLDKAPNLKVIFNVEGNFYQNIDYVECFKRNIRVLNCGEVYALPVAEMALAMAIDLSRGITWEHMRFREGRERYILDGNHSSRLLSGSKVGIIGFGLLGRSLRPLLEPFNCPVEVYDPWLPENVIREHNCTPVGLDELLANNEYIFIMAGVTSENQGFLAKRELDLIKEALKDPLRTEPVVVALKESPTRINKGCSWLLTMAFPGGLLTKDNPLH